MRLYMKTTNIASKTFGTILLCGNTCVVRFPHSFYECCFILRIFRSLKIVKVSNSSNEKTLDEKEKGKKNDRSDSQEAPRRPHQLFSLQRCNTYYSDVTGTWMFSGYLLKNVKKSKHQVARESNNNMKTKGSEWMNECEWMWMTGGYRIRSAPRHMEHQLHSAHHYYPHFRLIDG